MKILGTGLNGLIGSRVVELLSQHQFENVSRQTGFDITVKEDVFKTIESTDASVILHLAAKTHVDECEKEKSLGKESEAWKVNVLGTEYISEACKKNGKKLIYISTDFVFDGKNPPEKGYSESDTPNPINWYGTTKYEGEKKVLDASSDFIVARVTYPYRSSFEKLDFVRAIISKLSKNEEITAVSDQIITPTFIDDIVYSLDTLMNENESGIFHIVGSQWVSPYEAAQIIAEEFAFPKSLINSSSSEEFFKGRAPRPLHLKTKNDKIHQLGVNLKTFQEGIKKIHI